MNVTLPPPANAKWHGPVGRCRAHGVAVLAMVQNVVTVGVSVGVHGCCSL